MLCHNHLPSPNKFTPDAELIAFTVLLIPLIYIMPHIYTANKTYAVYMAEPVADIIAVTFTAVLFSFQFKRALRELQ